MDSVYKLNTIVTRGRSEQCVVRILNALNDDLKMDFIKVEDMSVTKLATLHCDLAILQMEFYPW